MDERIETQVRFRQVRESGAWTRNSLKPYGREAALKRLPLRLQVLRANRAKTLYLRLGFRVTGETVVHVLLERDLP